ncbi:macro domain-containing protein [Actinomadura sp. NEAU-AAG7]|uniref:macro domain-containing protein n=1 Tax=Actinomadura sp. NEAU-AAG7 TaxID=2839640 RepID=UPI001BE3EDC2|nr:macro domain-containing protein [Actinomadura sp. NEAU-AAG7]MBT2207290.1 Appr-1-p processing protein [Actinomadura sp. NEAU-AAG7]
MGVRYLKGDATSPQAKGVKIVAHVCNDLGGWGKGFVLAVSRRWKEPEAEYRRWYRERASSGFGLGAVQFVQVEKYVWVANMVAQRGVKRSRRGPPIRYEALGRCLEVLGGRAVELEASVHMPRVGCGLAGGKWELVEPLVERHLTERGVEVTVYDA